MSDTAGGLWSLVDERRRDAPPKAEPLQWVIRGTPVLVLSAALAMAVLLPRGLDTQARLALFAFGLAVIFWSLSKINAAYVAIAAVLLLVLSGAVPQDRLFSALASDVVWLMIGAFVLGGAVQDTGLAARLTRLVAARTRSVGQMLWLLTTILLPLAFVIPSTSGRAAIAVPLFRSLSDAADDPKVTRAMALLIPTVILVTTIASLVGAGSHLIGNDLLSRIGGTSISFGQWMLFGTPFAIAAGYASCWVIGRLFLDGEARGQALKIEQADAGPLSRSEWTTLAITAIMVGLWLTEAWHGIEIATVSVAGALALTAPQVGVLSWKAGLKAVSWNLVVFVGAALVLGQALIETGGAQWIIERMFAASGIAQGGSTPLILVSVVLISLTSHIYMTSHAARTAALIPPLLFLAQRLDLNLAAMMFIGTVGIDYCLTFPVSSKALLMFQELDRETWTPADLLKLSAVLLPVHAALMVVFYYGWWRHVGLAF